MDELEEAVRGKAPSPAPVATPAKAKVKPNHYKTPGPTGNAVGAATPATSPNPYGNSQPATPEETPEESFWDQFKKGMNKGAQYYKDHVSQSLHEFADSAMDTGGKVASAGGATVLAGGAVAATGVGAPVAAGLGVAGAATTAVGGGVAAVGGVSETAATAFDQAAEMILTGKTPHLVAPAISLAQRLLDKAVTSRIPGAGLLGKKKPAPPKKSDGKGGGYDLGVGGPCIVGPYERIKNLCGVGQQAHHIVPDTLNRTSNRAQGAKGIGRIPGMPSLAGGPAICLQGHAKTDGSEHNTAHQADSDIQASAQRTDNGPVGTLPVSEAVPKTMNAAIAARPECKAQIEAAVRKAYPDFEKDNRSMNGAGKPASGEAKAHLEGGGEANNAGRVRAKPRKGR